MRTLKNQFLFDLGKVYDAEYRIAKALPQMIKPDTSEDLKRAILSHARDTESHVTKVEEIFECFGHCPGGNTAEVDSQGDPITADFRITVANDSALISALKMIEHNGMPPGGCQREWEIASYGCLNEWAKLLGNSEGADLLEQILEEEQAARQGDADRSRMMNDRAV
jgi:ferritin-like metal-binding protein YciE